MRTTMHRNNAWLWAVSCSLFFSALMLPVAIVVTMDAMHDRASQGSPRIVSFAVSAIFATFVTMTARALVRGRPVKVDGFPGPDDERHEGDGLRARMEKRERKEW